MNRFCGATFLTLMVCLAGCGENNESLTSGPTNEPSGNTPSAIEQSVAAISSDVPFSNRFDHVFITEASGLQRSKRLDGVYYTHNDSGGEAILFATDASGHDLGTLTLTGIEPNDWEGIAGARLNGEASLVIADIGDNGLNRGDISLLVVTEPDLNSLSFGFDVDVSSRPVSVSYADGLSYDAEAVFIDGDNDTVVVFTKNFSDTTQQAMWKGSLAAGLTAGRVVLEYRGLVFLADEQRANAITDIDIHPNGRELAVLTYGPLATGRIHIWTAKTGEGTADALLRSADNVISVPLIGTNIQAEAISYSPGGDYLLVGAEAISSSTLTVVQRRN